MLKWLKDNLSIVAALAAVVLWIGGAVVHAFLVKSDVNHSLDSATRDRELLHSKDEQLDKRIEVVEASQAAQTVQLTQIQTQQRAIERTGEKIDKSVLRLDDKIERLLRR